MPAPAAERTVLLVEDDPDNRIIFRTILEFHGHRVVEAADGEAGVELARSTRPDMILMDITLPRLDGWSAIRLLRDGPETAAIPIVALTALVLEADRVRAAELGCVGYLSKPIALGRILAEVDRVLAM